MTFVSDTVAGFMAAASTPGVEGRTINLGTGQTFSVGWFAEKILSLMGVEKAIKQDAQRMRPEKSEVLKLVSDNSLARELLGWRPKTSLEDGLRQAIDFVRAHRDLYETTRYVV